MGLYIVTDSLAFIQYPPPNRNLYPFHSSAAAAAVVMVRAVDSERLKIAEGVEVLDNPQLGDIWSDGAHMGIYLGEYNNIKL